MSRKIKTEAVDNLSVRSMSFYLCLSGLRWRKCCESRRHLRRAIVEVELEWSGWYSLAPYYDWNPIATDEEALSQISLQSKRLD